MHGTLSQRPPAQDRRLAVQAPIAPCQAVLHRRGAVAGPDGAGFVSAGPIVVRSTDANARGVSRAHSRANVRLVTQVFAVAVLAWTVWWIHVSFAQWSRDQRCGYFAGPFLPCGPGPDAWKTPALIALLPLTSIGLWCTIRFLIPRRWRKG
jgi:hypothetical protein